MLPHAYPNDTTDKAVQGQDAATKLRKAPQAEGLIQSSVADIARGVVARTSPAVSHKNMGRHHMAGEWARYQLTVGHLAGLRG